MILKKLTAGCLIRLEDRNEQLKYKKCVLLFLSSSFASLVTARYLTNCVWLPWVEVWCILIMTCCIVYMSFCCTVQVNTLPSMVSIKHEAQCTVTKLNSDWSSQSEYHWMWIQRIITAPYMNYYIQNSISWISAQKQQQYVTFHRFYNRTWNHDK